MSTTDSKVRDLERGVAVGVAVSGADKLTLHVGEWEVRIDGQGFAFG